MKFVFAYVIIGTVLILLFGVPTICTLYKTRRLWKYSPYCETYFLDICEKLTTNIEVSHDYINFKNDIPKIKIINTYIAHDFIESDEHGNCIKFNMVMGVIPYMVTSYDFLLYNKTSILESFEGIILAVDYNGGNKFFIVNDGKIQSTPLFPKRLRKLAWDNIPEEEIIAKCQSEYRVDMIGKLGFFVRRCS